MNFFKDFLKKARSQKGITGTDVAVAIIIISATIAVITGIYINITRGSKENIRYSAATRITTQIAEKIEAISYEELASNTIWSLDATHTTSANDRKILGISIPKGYEVEITETKVSSGLDIIKKYNIKTTYRVNEKFNDIVTAQVVKERELLEQTNKPDLYLIDGYSKESFIYPIKKISSGYVITTESDNTWYNYDKGYYAQVYISPVKREIGDVVNPTSGEIYVWIPRFGKTTTSQFKKANLTYLYGTSKHSIVFKNVSTADKFYTYTVSCVDGVYTDAKAYINNTFTDNDGLTGMWYLIGGTNNSTKATTAYNSLISVLPKTN